MALYLLAIIPPPEFSEQIHEIREELSLRYKVFAALKPPVHITLYRPLNIPEDDEIRVCKLLQPIFHKHDPFAVQLNNFGCFNVQTAFINVLKNDDLGRLQRDISSVISRNKIDRKEAGTNTTFHAHITVAYHDIPLTTFQLMWEELKNRKFKRSFPVKQISLLKHDGFKWQPFQEFTLRRLDSWQLFS